MPEYVRVAQTAAVRHPDHGHHVVPRPGATFATDDPLVKAYPWMFETLEEAAQRESEGPPTEVVVEAATADPGKKRRTTKSKK